MPFTFIRGAVLINLETGGDTLAPKKQKYLPKKILDAVDRVLELDGMRAGVRVTLQTICKYVSKDSPLGPVFTRREKIARRAGLSVATVNRHLQTLKTLGYIRIENQRHGKHTGAFLVTHIFLTETLAKNIGLLQPESPVSCEIPSLKMSNAPIKKLTNPSSTKKQERPALSEITVPQDLTPLLQMGVWPQTICKIMKDAQSHGKRLSDVFVAVRHRLEALKLTGAQVARYLKKTIASNTDFAASAYDVLEKARAKEQAQADATHLAAFRKQWQGRTLSSPDGNELLVFAESGEHALHVLNGMRGSLPLCHIREVRAIEKRLAQGSLRPARQAHGELPISQKTRARAPAGCLHQLKALLGLNKGLNGSITAMG